jgi:hypothetical protein
MRLPEITAYTNRRVQQEKFGGINHTFGAGGGELYDMKNLSARYYPLLAPRARRYTVRKNDGTPNGIFTAGKLYEVYGTKLYIGGEEKATVADSEKTFCALGERVLIFPDKIVCEKDGTIKPMEASYSASGLKFGDGTYADEKAAANSITTTGTAFLFNVGDAVTIEGCTKEPYNNRTPVIREISDDKKTLRFYENTFRLPDGQTSITETGTVTLKRTVPDMDYVCTNENRVWGCKGDSIYASKLGDPYNWNVFENLATSSFNVESGTAGAFTACVSYLGYPCFFKEGKIFKMYGTIPTNFQLMSSAVLGVQKGSAKSLAVAGETLYYLSKVGIMSYSGGMPRCISRVLGEEVRFSEAVGGSDGLNYYVSMKANGTSALYCYSSENGTWHKEDALAVVQMSYHGGIMALIKGGCVLLGNPADIPEGAQREGSVSSEAEFADYDGGSFDAKHVQRVRARIEAEAGAALSFLVKFDSGAWEEVDRCGAQEKGIFTLDCPIRRCDHFKLKIKATGEYRLYALEYEYVTGGRK